MKLVHVNEILNLCGELRALSHYFSDLFADKNRNIKCLKADYFAKLGLLFLHYVQQSIENYKGYKMKYYPLNNTNKASTIISDG